MMSRLSIYLEPEIADILREVAEKQKMSISSLLRDMIIPDDSVIEKRAMHRTLVEEMLKQVGRKAWIASL